LCLAGDIITTTYTISYLNCLLTDTTSNITGTINQYISEICATSNFCILKAYSDVTLTVKKISLTPLNCQGIDSTIINRTASAVKFGPICPLLS
jgi:hypothetical protein